MASLIEMPELVMEKIIGFSHFKAVLTLRQVCRKYRTFIDDLKDSKLPDSKFQSITWHTSSVINWKSLGGKSDIFLTYEDQTGSQKHVYSGIQNSRSLNGKTTNLENSNIVDVAIRDLELVLKFQKSDLERFDINDGERQNELSSRTQLIKLNTMFRKLNRRIKARNFGIRTYDQSLIVPTLLFADPDTLEMLSLYAEVDDDWEMESDEIVKTEQWKKAEQFFSDIYLMNLKLENVCHFSRFEIKTNSITAGELNTLRKIFVSSPNCDRWEFGFKHFDEREQAELSNIWGPSFFFDYKRHWYFRLKNPEEEALLDFQMFCGQFGGGEGINCITFGVCEIEDVPNGAVIQDYNEN